jgi:hypothetical protein
MIWIVAVAVDRGRGSGRDSGDSNNENNKKR